jgi:FkbM family methyltransferase
MRIPLLLQIQVRSLGRRLGVTRAYWAVRQRVGTKHYEAAFGDALHAAVRRGDTIWDVGANVGLYTTIFSDLVGATGHVVAFEPAPAPFEHLSQAVAERSNVTLVAMALGAEAAVMPINVMADPRAGTHSLVRGSQAGATTVSVTVARGDRIRADRNLPTPNVIKIDVEGFEYEVLSGMAEILESSTCRAVLCEVHFGVLAQRGLKNYPRRIEQYLRDHDFSTHWVDASHLAATRDKPVVRDTPTGM